ncbi:hypothetical protein [Vibrio sp. D431a]|uniref:hypothetical protein n=1 Tax=Vibrio sp. D431a TaxID=2837388 RepID=UPI0025573B5A|nr:hypothetical protein [Vibrio sp. D431a]MDK9789807.1 hypothetical protein [Vibrio sp. D431a]
MLRSLRRNVTLLAKSIVGNANESLQDEHQIDLLKQEIVENKKTISKAEDELIEQRATLSVKDTELKEYHERRAELETNRDALKVQHSEAVESGDDEKAQRAVALAMKIKNKLKELDVEYMPQIEDFERSQAVVQELERTIDEKTKGIEMAEREIKSMEDREKLLSLHEQTSSLTDSLNDMDSDNSALARAKRNQEIRAAKIDERKKRNQVKSTSLEDEIAEHFSSETEDDPWA